MRSAGVVARRLRTAAWLRKASRWRATAPAAAALWLSACVGNEHLSFLDPQGPIAHAQMLHFYRVLGVMVVFVAGPIFLALPFFLWRYRYGNHAARYAPKWQSLWVLEAFTWTGPVLIVCGLGYFVWRGAHRLDPYRPIASSKPALRVQVIGYDWKWLFIYPDQRIATLGTLVLPAGRPVALQLTSATVMQSFFIPALGSQIYAMGGMDTRLNLEASRPGRFLGENTMYSGDGFHAQKFTAIAVTPANFRDWARGVQATAMPFSPDILAAIARRTTRAQLIASLPRAAARDGSVYLSGVEPGLFERVIEATRAGTSPAATRSPDRPSPARTGTPP